MNDRTGAARLVSSYSFGICRDFSEFVGVSVKELVESDGGEPSERERCHAARDAEEIVEKFVTKESPRWVTKISQPIL